MEMLISWEGKVWEEGRCIWANERMRQSEDKDGNEKGKTPRGEWWKGRRYSPGLDPTRDAEMGGLG